LYGFFIETREDCLKQFLLSFCFGEPRKKKYLGFPISAKIIIPRNMKQDERDGRFAGILPVSHNKNNAGISFKFRGSRANKNSAETLEIIV
jgi:hypothetical protein